jgi:hypothetical protein
MLPHLFVFLASIPLQVALGVWNTRRRYFTPGEVRFWGVALFVAAEFVYLGVF